MIFFFLGGGGGMPISADIFWGMADMPDIFGGVTVSEA